MTARKQQRQVIPRWRTAARILHSYGWPWSCIADVLDKSVFQIRWHVSDDFRARRNAARNAARQ